MIVVYTSDLHGNKELYSELFELAEDRRAQAVIIGGDMLPMGGSFQYSLVEQKDFIFFYLEPEIRGFLSKAPQATIYAMLGNDDWGASNTHLKNLEGQGILSLLHGRRHALGDNYELIAEYRSDLLNGITILTNKLHNFIAIPYYAWSNRGKSEMITWIPRD